MKIRWARTQVHALICALTLGAVATIWALENAGYGAGLTNWEFRFRDWLTASGGFVAPDPRLVFLAIDASSVNFSSLDLQTLYANVPADSRERHALELIAGGWPWSREVYALVADRLLTAGARGVVFDLLLPKPGAGDEILRATIAQHRGQIVLGENFVSNVIGPGRQAWSLDLPTNTILPNESPGDPVLGYVNFWPGSDGVVRSAYFRQTIEQLEGAKMPNELPPETPAALATRGAAWLGAENLPRPFEARLLRFCGPPGAFVPIPLYQIFLPEYWQRQFASGELLRGKVVLVGPAGNWAHDEHQTAFGLMPGPELHLQAMNAIIHGAFLREWPGWAIYFLLAAACALSFCLTNFITQTTLRAAAFVLLGAGFLFAVKIAHDYAASVLPAVAPTFALGLSGFVSFVYDYTRERMEKLRARRTLESYVSKDVVREILDNRETFLNSLGGQRTRVAVIMTDLRGFTTLSEQMDSHQLVTQLNEYLSVMVNDVFAQGGSVDKFVGDAVLAVWGSLRSLGPADDAKNALLAALRMQKSLEKLNADWTNRGLQKFAMGCGLNSGEVVFGHIGSLEKKELTVIGDTVNVTARLEGLTKDYGCNILIGEAAAELLRDEFRLQFVDRVAVKGKKKALKLYTVHGAARDPIEQKLEDYLALHAEACTAYRQRNFREASEIFLRCRELHPDDLIAPLYLKRCEDFLAQAPPDEWEGVWVAEHK